MRPNKLIFALTISAFALLVSAHGELTAGPDDVYLRVVDVGPGLCVVAKIPDGHHILYDGGHWQGKKCLAAVREIVGSGAIDLLIISHSDADHLSDADDILKQFRVNQIIRTGFERTSGAWKNANGRIGEEAKSSATVINLQTFSLVPGMKFQLGRAAVTIVAGWPRWDEPGPDEAERRNVIGIVAKLEYQAKAVLLTGDTVGRRKDDPDNACKDAEKVMVDNHKSGKVSLASDVIVAPHHGGNNASSTCFIEAVHPSSVIFSAGHEHQHPTKGAAERYIQQGVAIDHIFRTDRGDDESGSFEWKHGSIKGCQDKRGDDDVDVVLRENGNVEVEYRKAQNGC